MSKVLRDLFSRTPLTPTPRRSHESALVDGHLFLFGGSSHSTFFPRHEIWSMNVCVATSKRKWIRHLTQSREIPPPCRGAQCVEIDKMLYSYGGEKKDGDLLGEVYRLDLKEMVWIKVATPVEKKRPISRESCCLSVVGSRFIMFGGWTYKMPCDEFQAGASQSEGKWNNEIYEFVFEEKRRKGMWLDLELSGKRPMPLVCAAMATIDQYRAFLHGTDDTYKESHSFVLDLQMKGWITINFHTTPSPRWGHSLCKVFMKAFEGESIFLLIGGCNVSASESLYVLAINDQNVYEINVGEKFASVYFATSHCLQNRGDTTEILVYSEGLRYLPLASVEAFIKSEQELCSLMPVNEAERPLVKEAATDLSDVGRHEMEKMKDELHRLRHRCTELEKELQVVKAAREELASVQLSAAEVPKEILVEREEKAVALRRCQTLEASRDEIKKRLDEFVEVLTITSDEICVTEQNLGSGAFAGVCVGYWRGKTVAVKKFYEVITNRRNLALFRREVLVCSRLHHPNIITVCGAVMEEGIPFQMIIELLEGSVTDVVDAAHASTYLTLYEQLSLAMDITSAIAYLHQTRPMPYVHGDIRPSNVLVTRDMKAKVGDLGAAHIIQSSLSIGPMSPDYLAPERMPRGDGTAASSSLPSDVYSLGVTLIEIFTGVCPIPDERQTQVDALSGRPKLFLLCSSMIEAHSDNRPTSQNSFDILKTFAESDLSEFVAVKRLVNGVFERNTHKVVLSYGVDYS